MTESKKTEAQEINRFVELNEVSVSKYVEEKRVKNKQTGQVTVLKYLSWPFAIAEIKKRDMNANWQFLDPIIYPDSSVMVHCNFTCFGITHYMWLPVMDFKNQAQIAPNSVDINKAMMRCLVKAIAVHGLGLYIYAGEDLPEAEKDEAQQHHQQQRQNTQQQPAQQQNNVPTHASQLSQDDQKTACISSLDKIDKATTKAQVDKIFAFWNGVPNHQETIGKACQAKADREGWTNQGGN